MRPRCCVRSAMNVERMVMMKLRKNGGAVSPCARTAVNPTLHAWLTMFVQRKGWTKLLTLFQNRRQEYWQRGEAHVDGEVHELPDVSSDSITYNEDSTNRSEPCFSIKKCGKHLLEVNRANTLRRASLSNTSRLCNGSFLLREGSDLVRRVGEKEVRNWHHSKGRKPFDKEQNSPVGDAAIVT